MSFDTIAKRSPRASKAHSFLIGLGQMFLMSINVRNMAEGNIVFLFLFTLINTRVIVWTVRLNIHSTSREVDAYAVGSAIGATLGVSAHHLLITPHAFTRLATLL